MPTGQNDVGRNAFGLSPSEVVTYFYHWLHVIVVMIYRVEKKIPAKFVDTCSIRADGLCIGCLGQCAERGRDNLNMQE